MAKCMQCGEATKMKKMKTGGASNKKGLCPDGYYWSVQGCIDKLGNHPGPLSSTSAKVGVGSFLGGLVTAAGTKIAQKIKAKQANKKEAAQLVKTLKDANLKKKGGAVKSKKR